MRIEEKICTKCGSCIKVCPRHIITPDFTINTKRCIECGHCMAICPVQAISHEGVYPEKTAAHKIKAESFEKLVKAKRSCRHFTKKPIPEEMLSRLSELSRFAPTGSNKQQVHTTLVVSAEKRKRITKLVADYYKRKVALALKPGISFLLSLLSKAMVKKAGAVNSWLERFYSKGEDIICFDAPAIAVFHCPTTASTPSQDAVIAATQYTLHAETLGLGSCFVGFIVDVASKDQRLREALNLPPNHTVYATVVLGHPLYTFKNSVIRKESEIKIV